MNFFKIIILFTLFSCLPQNEEKTTLSTDLPIFEGNANISFTSHPSGSFQYTENSNNFDIVLTMKIEGQCENMANNSFQIGDDFEETLNSSQIFSDNNTGEFLNEYKDFVINDPNIFPNSNTTNTSFFDCTNKKSFSFNIHNIKIINRFLANACSHNEEQFIYIKSNSLSGIPIVYKYPINISASDCNNFYACNVLESSSPNDPYKNNTSGILTLKDIFEQTAGPSNWTTTTISSAFDSDRHNPVIVCNQDQFFTHINEYISQKDGALVDQPEISLGDIKIKTETTFIHILSDIDAFSIYEPIGWNTSNGHISLNIQVSGFDHYIGSGGTIQPDSSYTAPSYTIKHQFLNSTGIPISNSPFHFAEINFMTSGIFYQLASKYNSNNDEENAETLIEDLTFKNRVFRINTQSNDGSIITGTIGDSNNKRGLESVSVLAGSLYSNSRYSSNDFIFKNLNFENNEIEIWEQNQLFPIIKSTSTSQLQSHINGTVLDNDRVFLHDLSNQFGNLIASTIFSNDEVNPNNGGLDRILLSTEEININQKISMDNINAYGNNLFLFKDGSPIISNQLGSLPFNIISPNKFIDLNQTINIPYP